MSLYIGRKKKWLTWLVEAKKKNIYRQILESINLEHNCHTSLSSIQAMTMMIIELVCLLFSEATEKKKIFFSLSPTDYHCKHPNIRMNVTKTTKQPSSLKVTNELNTGKKKKTWRTMKMKNLLNISNNKMKARLPMRVRKIKREREREKKEMN